MLKYVWPGFSVILALAGCGTPRSELMESPAAVDISCRIYRFVGEEFNLVLTARVVNGVRLERLEMVDKATNAVVLARDVADYDADYHARSGRRQNFHRFSVGSGQGNWWDGFSFQVFLPKDVSTLTGRFQGELEERASDGGAYSKMYCYVK